MGRNPGEVTKRFRVHQQDAGGEDIHQELEQDPVMAEEAPGRSQGLHDSADQRGEAQRDKDKPANRVHREMDGPQPQNISGDQADNREDEEASDSAEPPDRRCDVRGEYELAEVGRHGHYGTWPLEGFTWLPWAWRPGPCCPPPRSMTMNIRSTTAASAAKIFTQRGVPVGCPRSVISAASCH